MKELRVKNIIISKQGKNSENYQRFKKIVNEKNIKIITVGEKEDGNPLRININKEIYFKILWPHNSKMINENVLNNNSIVCQLCFKNFSLLFTGDIEEIAEKEILNEYKNNLYLLNSTILKVGHHGSKTSSTQDFINAVKPKIALIGVGKNNKFGHPNDQVIERLKENGVKVYRTDEMGEISISVNYKGIIKVNKFITYDNKA